MKVSQNRILKIKVATLLIGFILSLGFIALSGFGGTNFISKRGQIARARTNWNDPAASLDITVPDEIPVSYWHEFYDFTGQTLSDFEGSGTPEDPYLIQNVRDLALLGQLAVSDNLVNVHFKQTADISLGENTEEGTEFGPFKWRPIGSPSRSFQGVYDGDGYTISNLIVWESNENAGLFRSLSNAVVKNLNIVDGYVNCSNYNYAGLIAGQASNSQLKNISVHGIVSGFMMGSESGIRNYIGGVVGSYINSTSATAVTLEEIRNYARVRGGVYVGGIAGRLRNAQLADCYNAGDIYSDIANSGASVYLGGLVGLVETNSTLTDRELAFSALVNSGVVSSTACNRIGGIIGDSNTTKVILMNDVENTGDIEGRTYVGGIAGIITNVELSKGKNTGNISGRADVGGLFGRAYRAVLEDVSNGASGEALQGNIFAEDTNAGGIIGHAYRNTVLSGVVNYGSIEAGTYNSDGGAGGFIGTLRGLDCSIESLDGQDPENFGTIRGFAGGGAIGNLNNAEITIKNFTNSGNVYCQITPSGIRSAGGVVGYATRTKINIENSANNANIEGANVGGAIGLAQSLCYITIDTFQNTHDFEFWTNIEGSVVPNPNVASLGGVIGNASATSLHLNNISNEGKLISGGNYVGGLIGGSGSMDFTLTDSQNSGQVMGLNRVGGIAGSANGEMESVVNTGSVYGSGDYIGGIVGYTLGIKMTEVTNGTEGHNDEVSGPVGGGSTFGVNVGGLIGYTHNGSIVNITDSVNYMDVIGRTCVGGLIGRSTQNTTITNSENNGEVWGEMYYVGGLVGYQLYGKLDIRDSQNFGNAENTYVGTESQGYYAVGGIVGSVRNAGTAVSITDVSNYGEVTGQFAGGIMGYNESANLGNIVFTRVVNEQTATVQNGNLMSGTTQRPGYAGGILGAGTGSNGTAVINDCVNKAEVIGQYAGGLVGWSFNVSINKSKNIGTIQNNYANAGFGGLVYRVVRASIKNSYNNGGFLLNQPVLYGGGLIGYCPGSSNIAIEDSYNLTNITATETTGTGTYVSSSAIGGLIGYLSSTVSLNITSSYNKGNIDAAVTYAGGLIGRIINNYGSSTTQRISSITNSFSNADVNCGNSTNNAYAGGLVGEANNGLHIKNSDAKGNIGGSYFAGGIMGRAAVYLAIPDVRNGYVGEMVYNVITVEDSSFIGELVNGESANANRCSGGVIGWVEYVGTAPASMTVDNDIVALKVERTFAVAKHTGSFANNKGYVGRITFRNLANPTMHVYVNDSYFAIDDPEYPDIPTQPESTYSAAHRAFILNENCAAFTIEELKDAENYEGFDFVGGSENTFWGISEEYNDGFPYHRNVYPGTITFHANALGAEFGEDGHSTYVVDTFVGNNLMLVEYVVPRPVLKNYDFKGWSTTPDGEVEYVYGDLYSGAGKENVDLYAVWAPEQIWVELEHPAKLFDGENVSDSLYVSRGQDKVIRYTINESAGEIFANWEIYNPSTGQFEEYDGLLTAEGYIPLATVLDDDFIDNYVFITGNDKKAFRVRQVITGVNEMIMVNFAENSPQNPGNFKINDDTYRTGTWTLVASGQEMTLEVNPRAHYKVKSIVFRSGTGDVLTDVEYTNPSENIFNITVTGRMSIEIELEKVQYEVIVRIADGSPDGQEIGEDLIIGDENSIYAKIDEDLPEFEADETDDYRFIGFKVYHFITNQFVTYTNDTPITSTFLSNHVGPDGKLIISAVFVRRYDVAVTVELLDDGQGNSGDGIIKIYEIINGLPVQLTQSTNTLDNGAVILLEAIPEQGSTFEGFEGLPAGAIVSGPTARFTLDSDLNIKGKFSISFYSIQTFTVDSQGNIIDDDEAAVIVGDGTVEKVLLGSKINVIGLDKVDLPGYQFMGWYFKVGDQFKAVTVDDGFTFDANGFITNVEITNQFIQEYVDPATKNLIIVAQYYELYNVTLEMNDDSMGGYEIFTVVNGNAVAAGEGQQIFVHGTVLKIKAVVKNAEYYVFTGFEGTLNDDVFDEDQVELTITVLGNRHITLNFQSNNFTLKQTTIQTSAKGDFNVSKTDIKMNDEVVISFTPEFGYEIRSWHVYDKNGKKWDVSELSDNITLSGNTLILKVDEQWMNNFGTDFKSEVKTMINSVYLTLLLIAAIVTPLLLAGIIIYFIQNRRKKAQAIAAQRRSEVLQRALSTEDFMKQLKDEANKE